MYICIYVHMYICMYICIYVCIYVYMHVYGSVSVCVVHICITSSHGSGSVPLGSAFLWEQRPRIHLRPARSVSEHLSACPGRWGKNWPTCGTSREEMRSMTDGKSGFLEPLQVPVSIKHHFCELRMGLYSWCSAYNCQNSFPSRPSWALSHILAPHHQETHPKESRGIDWTQLRNPASPWNQDWIYQCGAIQFVLTKDVDVGKHLIKPTLDKP